MRAMLALVLHLGGVGECVRLIWEWSVHNQETGDLQWGHTILKPVAASAAEAKLGALFLNAQDTKVFRLVLAKLGHPQPPTLIHIDNTTTVGILNNTIKCQRSRSMEMRYFWL